MRSIALNLEPRSPKPTRLKLEIPDYEPESQTVPGKTGANTIEVNWQPPKKSEEEEEPVAVM